MTLLKKLFQAAVYNNLHSAVLGVIVDKITKLNHHYQEISLALGLKDPSEYKSQVMTREIPQGSRSILITSHNPLSKSIFTRRPSGLDLSPLTQQDSISLFNHLTTTSNEPEDNLSQQISDKLGSIPLTISQIAGIIQQQDLTLLEFFKLYMDYEEYANLYKTKFNTSLVTYNHSLSTIWLISFVNPDIISEDFLIEVATKFLKAKGIYFKKSNYINAQTNLLQSSLIQRDRIKYQISHW
ncbi:tetratricopeptide repeat domain-containing protein [Penicillium herquei]|nr:tetratricopeptide repeat domain-containing protein [Penicillium herquei]